MANQRFSRSTGRAETPLTAVVLLVLMPRSDQKLYKVEGLFSTAGAPASQPLTGALTMHPGDAVGAKGCLRHASDMALRP